VSAGSHSTRTLFEELSRVIARIPSMPHYEMYCHPSVYYAIQRIGDIQPVYPPQPLDRFMGIDLTMAPELGPGVWEIYGNGKLLDYGKVAV